MIKIEKTEIYGWDAAIRGCRNPMNSWAKSDSFYTHIEDEKTAETANFQYFIGENDKKLMKQLCKAGTDHRKFMRMITVYVDITAPLYWWKEFDTYKVGTVANSCSTMHKIAEKEFTIDDFSHERLCDDLVREISDTEGNGCDIYITPISLFEMYIAILNECRNEYLKTKDKKYWWQMIQLLPSSYNQKRTILMNYEALANMYHSRKNHKLDEWREFCKWIEELPHSDLITGEEE